MKLTILLCIIFLCINSSRAQAIINLQQKENLLLLEQQFHSQWAKDSAEVVKYASDHGLPVIIEDRNGNIGLMIKIQNGKPIYLITNNLVAAKTISTNEVWTGGVAGLSLNGYGIKIGEWDGGKILLNHKELAGRVNWLDGFTFTTNEHSTHVAGTLIASGENLNAHGMAAAATINDYDMSDDISEMTYEAAEGLLLSNHSYGSECGWKFNNDDSVWEYWGDYDVDSIEDYKFGFYDSRSNQLDLLTYNANYFLPVISVGNDENDTGPQIFDSVWRNCESGSCELFPTPLITTEMFLPPPDYNLCAGGYDCIPEGFSTAKNGLVIGSVQDLPSGYNDPIDIVPSVFSSIGPTDDGRIKPDLMGNGENLLSSGNASKNSYITKSGTSMASPNVCGSLALLQQHYYNLFGGFMKSATLKALVIHTADHPIQWPSYSTGWGLMNTEAAAEVISASQSESNRITETVIQNDETLSLEQYASGSEPIKVTIVWNDPPLGFDLPIMVDNTTPALVNDIDLTVERMSDGHVYYPFKLDKDNPSFPATTTGKNYVDNVEYVYIDEADLIPGNYKINVSPAYNLLDGTQEFSMIVSGMTQLPSPLIQSQNTIGGSLDDFLTCIEPTSDGGYIVGGHSLSNIGADKTENCLGQEDLWIVKFNAAGSVQWQNTIGGTNADYMGALHQTGDGGYVIGATTYSGLSGDKTENTNGGSDYWVIKLNSSGNIVWQNAIGGTGEDWLSSIVQTSDDGYFISGYSNSPISGDKIENTIGPIISNYDYWILKLDASGIIQWQNTIGGGDADYLKSGIQTSDGGYLLAAYSNSNILGDKNENSKGLNDFWLVKVNSSGTIIWQKTYGGSLQDQAYKIIKTSDGGFLVGGISVSNISGDKTQNTFGSDDIWVMKINSIGDILWQKDLGGNLHDALFNLSETSDYGFLLSGYSNSPISGIKSENSMGLDDGWLLKLNSAGSIVWQNTLGGNNYDEFQGGFEAIDGSYILGGFSNSSISGDKTENSNGGYDYWIIKLVNGCTFPDTVLNASGPTTFCNGLNVTLSAQSNIGFTYQWYKNGAIIPGATNSDYVVNKSGTYFTHITNGGCDVNSMSAIVTVNPKPNAAITNLDTTNDLCFDTSIKLKSNTDAGYTYQWYKGASVIAGATNYLYYATTTGSYKVKVANAYGCNKTSTPYTIIKTCKEGQMPLNSINIYPNPTSHFLNILSENDISLIVIYNSTGQIIYSKTGQTGLNNILVDLSDFPAGLYFVKVRTVENESTQAILKQ